MMTFENLSSKIILFLMRDAFYRQIWRKRGFDSLDEWAQTRFNGTGQSSDTIQRYLNVIRKVVAPLDATPKVVDGKPITGSALLEMANPTALQKLSGHYMNGDEDKRTALLRGLASGTSDYKRIKAGAGWTPPLGKWPATFIQAVDENGEVVWTAEFPRLTHAQYEYMYRLLETNLTPTVISHGSDR